MWVRMSLTNYMWLASLAWWLCKEYQYRYGDQKIHKTEAHVIWLMNNSPKSIPFVEFTRPALAMPDQYKQEDVIESYKMFYIESKLKERNIVKYTRRECPEFLRMYIAEPVSQEYHTHQISLNNPITKES